MQNTFNTHRSNFLIGLLLAICMSLTACGFQLRGSASLAFKTLMLQGANLTISRELTRNIKANEIIVTTQSKNADVFLELLNESNSKRIQSLSGTGVVREFELYYQVSFRVRDAAKPEWDAIQTIQLRRDYSYNDDVILGKAEEEARLNKDMQSDAVREIIRRLSAVRIAPK